MTTTTLNSPPTEVTILWLLVGLVWLAGLFVGVYFAVIREKEPKRYSRTLHLVAGLLVAPLELVLGVYEE